MALRDVVSFRPADLGALAFVAFAFSLAGACGGTNSAGHLGDAGDAAAVADAGDAGLPSDDALPPGSVSDATACATISASSYEQTCANDADCVAIAEGDPCVPCGLSCPAATINAGALAQYRADIANTPAETPSGQGCGVSCAIVPGPCCRAGRCHADAHCLMPATTDAGSDAAPPAVTDGGSDGLPDSASMP
jgi:hypothetical protein